MGIKNWLKTHKYQIMFSLIIVAMFFIVGCTTGQGSAPPAGPIGGGCG